MYYLLAKIGADAVENEQQFAAILTKIRDVTAWAGHHAVTWSPQRGEHELRVLGPQLRRAPLELPLAAARSLRGNC